jgi:hypothetical protein
VLQLRLLLVDLLDGLLAALLGRRRAVALTVTHFARQACDLLNENIRFYASKFLVRD